MTLREFDIECGSGNITVNGISTSSIELHSASGDINATGAFTSIDVETNSGNAQVTNTSETINKIDANSTSGNITITVPQSLNGFYMEYETVSGSISNDFGAQTNGSSRNGTATYGNGSTQIEVETVSGSFHLKQLNKNSLYNQKTCGDYRRSFICKSMLLSEKYTLFFNRF